MLWHVNKIGLNLKKRGKEVQIIYREMYKHVPFMKKMVKCTSNESTSRNNENVCINK